MPNEVPDKKEPIEEENDSGAGAGFILFGLGLLVVGSLINASSRKKIETSVVKSKPNPVPKTKLLPEIKSVTTPIAPVRVVTKGQCTINGCSSFDTNPCHFCGKVICREHTEGCVCTGPINPWTCGCHKNGGSYCGSCD